MAKTTTATDPQLIGQYYDRLLLDNLYPQLYFYEFGTKKNVPGGSGKVGFWTRYKVQPAAAAITEGGAIATSILSASRVSATLGGYGFAVEHSDFLVMTAISDVVSDSVVEVSKSLALKIDNQIRGGLLTGVGNLVWGSVLSGTARKVINAHTVQVRDLLRPAAKLRSLNAKTFSDGCFAGIVPPDFVYQMQSNTAAGGWIDINKYATNDTVGMLYRGEVGKAYNVRYVSSTNVPVIIGAAATSGVNGLSTSTSGYNAFIFGPGAYGVVELDGGTAKTFIKQLGSAGAADPINQRATVGAKIYFAAANLQCASRLAKLAFGRSYV